MGKGIKILSSYKTAIALLLIYASGLAIATFMEKYWGVSVAQAFIYYSPLLFLVYLLLATNFILSTIKHRLINKKRPGFVLVHLAFLIILLGALITHLSGKEGVIHLREGETVSYMVEKNRKREVLHELPFSIQLRKFTLTRYPGSNSPSSFVSSLLVSTGEEAVEKEISMNNVLDIKGYRLFQASYDTDERGSILSVNKDAAGRNITYIGYIVLVAGFLFSLFGKNSRFRKLARLLILLLLPYTAYSQPPVDLQEATRFGEQAMISVGGRVQPVNTFASEVLRKLHKSDTFGSLNADQFLLGVTTIPEMWMHIPLIAYSNRDISFRYDLTENYCAYAELFDTNGNYKPEKELRDIFAKSPSQRTRFEKDLIKLDEQINIFHQLTHGELLNILSEDTGISVDTQKIQMELLYNRLEIFHTCKKAYLIVGGLLLALCFLQLFETRRWMTWITRLLIITTCIFLAYHLFGMGLRAYIAGNGPWSNSYETMVYVAFILVLAALFFVRKNSMPFALATLFAGVILFVAGLNWMNPQISPLVPVLKSPWLMFHVATIMAAYGLFAISFLLGATNLILLKWNKPAFVSRVRELSVINEMSLWIGLALLTTGTFLGAVWANESWGRYWGWDPKETWALITIIVYTATTHLHLVKKWDKPFLLNVATVLAFACVLMTYFGVNYLLSGMHAYA